MTTKTVMTDEDVVAALEKARKALEPMEALARAKATASSDEQQAMTYGALAQHHVDELIRLMLLRASVWLAMKRAGGQTNMGDRAEAIEMIRNVVVLLPLLDHEPRVMQRLG